jgi:hypothetical protein
MVMTDEASDCSWNAKDFWGLIPWRALFDIILVLFSDLAFLRLLEQRDAYFFLFVAMARSF